jgi:alpha-glucosidase (family GH31 glycosyl hydrolase)
VKKSHYTEEQIAFALHQAEQGIPVAEVTRKMGITEQDSCGRNIYFPEGGWYALGTEKRYEGGRWQEVETPLDWCPAFVREGAVIPMAEPVQTTAEYNPEEITLHAFAPKSRIEWESDLYEDDGESQEHMKGGFVSTTFTLKKCDDQLRLTGKSTGKGFNNSARKRFRVTPVGLQAEERLVDNAGDDFEIFLQ